MPAVLSVYQTVFDKQASEGVRAHALYAIVYLGFPQKFIAQVFGKSEGCISKWVKRYNETGSFSKKNNTTRAYRRLLEEHREWVIEYIKKDPLSYLQEVSKAFVKEFSLSISSSSVCRILHEAGYSNKVLERCAKDISISEIARFCHELHSLPFALLPDHLLFIDEISTDNRSMLRKRGWFLSGTRPVFHSPFRRGPRISLLTFLGVGGVVEDFETEGTFDRLLFFEFCKTLLFSPEMKVQGYCGKHSVWIMDGASIHLDKWMVEYFFSVGIIVIFLPAYCPFYNPIEILFSYVKKECKKLYRKEGTERLILNRVMAAFASFDALPIFEHCGYLASGRFDPNINYDIVANEIFSE
eukprot:Lithocolla_globosa_v1_NODE_4894_length_1344_cov_6.214119.p1 type:complete len:355 gc:universal NODE_4894_length_1344_cov_6.214119:194-1258(+)